ncbi:DEAD-box ATP-dependent RNA helicase 32-like isoform X1 [Gossypium hirsutum]|uniref:DEAD-box ATP-dependent RNA helicase 32-like isoform X1 n=1 Tax=Gossypium hirsutum TaxID=3635 RepID=A0ABM2ZJU5_GOSHI|nr:DEAD-box ATP-dependent RNA helicase 32-like isoform X1 [Gossypium hirsutum]XP_040942880.1 DEAD-box ATP-dependent RNA helicase 32-like isoform X1 [Gossypium hirsutum]XP_040942881.1 DEAD-box ATP-dependent RNA helicase 32-like isoform X1 [Gossypium hirsutum]XP_040942882.1 DEAD-box ATP-dependent RNA helicase 32-like isoform X1 [Gossypium hirsutum]XP_040942883.1 DEAD-box ATP-dependent RNA helicase 32-like isoform X1 [Gossypium hirsutum]XP_040942884.1 DEAD-box ATP-dependent RNA helicase 32-like i
MVELYNKTQRLPSPSINASAPFEKVSMKQNYHNEIRSATRILKKKKLKINVHRPVGTRVVFDEEGNTQAPLAMLADKTSGDILLDQDIEGVVEDSISSSS